MRRRPRRLAGVDPIEQATNDSAGERRRVDIRGVLREERGRGDAVDQHADFEVWLDDGHFDVERGDLVGERLRIICKFRAALHVEDGRTSQKPSRAQPEAQYTPRPGVPRWPAGRQSLVQDVDKVGQLERTNAREDYDVPGLPLPHSG